MWCRNTPIWAAIFAQLAFCAPVYAHGDAEWIMREPRYVTEQKVHCCGPSDCERAPKGAVVLTGSGWMIAANGQVFDYDSPALYISIDADFWWCRRDQKVVCLFTPGTGS